ncbi:PAS domain-containing sensor histidine kinase [Desulfopila aestuarii]|uniref:Oxygen sensor histidine kinase NreB n=1 Tax=Desulfopila aestuarii DSM 18488 TaxID=1121416 RepID=A0A1M7Y972_9BACT|nr:ATP-binding protein [Desulfopila aestuarii]SHO49149.1 Histidine kinase-, DNA gyrase B-, and HSP90-like ATPase [Desulfopila aestuarii DSM 18488]
MNGNSSSASAYFSSDGLVVLGVVLGAMSWGLESFIHSQIFYDQQRDFILSLLMPDRHELWMRCIIVALFVSFGFYSRKVIQALNDAREELVKVNTELVQIFDTAADGMRVIGADFSIQRANSTFLHLAGVGAMDVVGRKCHEVFQGESCHTDTCPMIRIQRGEARVEYDAVKMRQDGSRIPCIVTATPFYNSRRELVGIVEDFKDISERNKTEQALRDSHNKLHQVSTHLEMVREQERRTISREIHDELGQNLTGLLMDVQWLVRNQDATDADVDEKLTGMASLLNQTIQTVRRIASEIRPGVLDDLGLQAAIEAEADKVRDRLGILFDIVCLPEEMELDEQYRNTVFRIFKEALTNIIRHAGASRVTIRLMVAAGGVTLTVSDNGRGITEDEKRGNRSLGLASMHERAWLVGGSLRVFGEPGQGTTVFLNLPHAY